MENSWSIWANKQKAYIPSLTWIKTKQISDDKNGNATPFTPFGVFVPHALFAYPSSPIFSVFFFLFFCSLLIIPSSAHLHVFCCCHFVFKIQNTIKRKIFSIGNTVHTCVATATNKTFYLYTISIFIWIFFRHTIAHPHTYTLLSHRWKNDGKERQRHQPA